MQYLSTQYSSLSPDTPSRGGKAFGISDGPNTNNRGQGKNKKRRRGKGKGGVSNDSGQNSNPKRRRQQQAPQAPAATDTDDAADHSGHRNGWEDDLTPTAMAGQLHQWTATPSVSSTGSDSHLRIQQTRTTDHRFYCAAHGQHYTQRRELQDHAPRPAGIHQAAPPSQATRRLHQPSRQRQRAIPTSSPPLGVREERTLRSSPSDASSESETTISPRCAFFAGHQHHGRTTTGQH